MKDLQLHALGLTFDYLATAENEAASPLLLAALEHGERAVADGALQAVLRRQSPQALDALICRWHTLSDRWKELAAQRPGVLTTAVRTAFQSSDEQLIRNAVEAAVNVRDYDLAALFAQATLDPSPLRRRLACEAVLKLAETLYEELHGAVRGRARRDPQCLRDFLVGSLERPVTQFKEHHSREVLEAFLLLAPRESATFRHLLQDAQEPSHEPLCDQLLRSTRPGVIRLLLAMLDDHHAPLAPLRILGLRRDVGFFRQLCRKLAEDLSPQVQANLARISSLAWLDDDKLPILASLAESEQAGAVALAVGARISSSDKLRVLEHLLGHGQPLGRRAAARALFDIYGPQSDWLVLELIEDSCPLVQAEAVRRLRSCDIPDAVSMLIALLDSPHVEVQAAARHALEEFTLPRYLKAFESLSEEARRATGRLVKRVDPQATATLRAELATPGRPRRLRALQAVAALELAPELTDSLRELCRDENQAVRLEAASLLSFCEGPEARRSLRELLSDASTAVQQAAEQSLQAIATRDPLSSTVRFAPRRVEAIP